MVSNGWHFSYGDRAWAYVTKAKNAIYGLKSDDKEILNITKDQYLKNMQIKSEMDIITEAYKKNEGYAVDNVVEKAVLYLPIAYDSLKKIPIQECGEGLIDLEKLDNSRIKGMYYICKGSKKPYAACSLVRKGLHMRLVKMLDNLPANVGIAFQVAWRPLKRQKTIFDEQMLKRYTKYKNWEKAYDESCKFVSPFIDNIPTHCTGAAIDMTLFKIKKSGKCVLMDLGMFALTDLDTHQEQTFAPSVTDKQKKNRTLLLTAAAKSGLVNYGFEWWHFSYGDKAWAYVTKEKNAIYDLKSDGKEILNITLKEYIHNFEKSTKNNL